MYQDQNPNGYDPDDLQSDQQKQYQYSFQTGGGQPTGAVPQSPRAHEGHFVKVFLTVLLCVTLSFGAGVGGACWAYRRLAASKTADDGVNDPPKKESLNSADPESILDRTDREFSPYGSAGEDAFAISEVVRMVENSVVVIETTKLVSAYGTTYEVDGGSGSGVIIAEEGYILTCHHVVSEAHKVKVTLNTGGIYEAEVVGEDEASDLAVLKIQPIESEPLTAAKHGKSGNLVVGERVVAIGNPLGTLGGTVTDGIISATERQVATGNGTMTLLQTNAAINSGNSGGGLFNLSGELIGIVNAKYAASGVEGLAFAIPIDSAYTVECDLIEYGYVRGVIDHGLSLVEVNDSNLSYYRRYGLREKGYFILSSEYNEELSFGDRILTVNGVSISTAAQFEAVLEECKVGDTITLQYKSGTLSSVKTATITLREYVPDGATVDFS